MRFKSAARAFLTTQPSSKSVEMKVTKMGFFQDKSDNAYRLAAEAVKNGTANKTQREMNAEAAKKTGSIGKRATEATK